LQEQGEAQISEADNTKPQIIIRNHSVKEHTISKVALPRNCVVALGVTATDNPLYR
jgi:hypothetical protein